MVSEACDWMKEREGEEATEQEYDSTCVKEKAYEHSEGNEFKMRTAHQKFINHRKAVYTYTYIHSSLYIICISICITHSLCVNCISNKKNHWILSGTMGCMCVNVNVYMCMPKQCYWYLLHQTIHQFLWFIVILIDLMSLKLLVLQMLIFGCVHQKTKLKEEIMFTRTASAARS